MNLSSFNEGLSPEWEKALSNVLGFALSRRVRAITAEGANPSEVYSESRIRSLIRASLKEAVLGFLHHEGSRCLHLRCREEALVIAVATKEAKMRGRRLEEVEVESVTRLNEWMDGRN